MNDNYAKVGSDLDWKGFCEAIHDSDVVAFGITDYFSLDSYFDFLGHYRKIYGSSPDKAFFPNLELRLPEALNEAGQSVNIHVIFRPELTREEAHKFISCLKTEATTGESRAITCADLKTKTDFESATVSRDSIETAFHETFGKKANVTDHVIILTSVKGDGMRPGGKGSRKRKMQLADEIDKISQGFFGNPSSRDHFLDTNRLEANELIGAKPVFSGCDSHDFGTLDIGLGKHVAIEGGQHFITWVKADLTFEGLQQTLVEPEQRVSISPIEPDQKEPYNFISEITFEDTNDFPQSIAFNRNLNSIIGSRSSGKSALLAYIAFAVDPEETIEVQMNTFDLRQSETGPAAGKTWNDVADIKCRVKWGDNGSSQGKVIYIPQNSLNKISEQPSLITKKIEPSLFRSFSEFKREFEKAMYDIDAADMAIARSVNSWFDLAQSISTLDEQLLDSGEKSAVVANRDRLQTQIDDLKRSLDLTDAEVATYQDIVAWTDAIRLRIEEIVQHEDRLSSFVDIDPIDTTKFVVVDSGINIHIELWPSLEDLPEEIQSDIEDSLTDAANSLSDLIAQKIIAYRQELQAERLRLENENLETDIEFADLLAKNRANELLESLVESHVKQVGVVAKIEAKEKARSIQLKKQRREVSSIKTSLNSREGSWSKLLEEFRSEERRVDDLIFGLEYKYNVDSLINLSQSFKKNEIGTYVLRVDQIVDIEKAHKNTADFLKQLYEGTQKLNQNATPESVAITVLTEKKEVRFSAELDGDVIGGFRRSSMTPGKQALFALTLILNESDELWPLLIDQPEDDLDSRSIYDTIVPYLTRRKTERQIIMVSHNANLVVGADSEELIVANRHGDDRKNADERTFDYLTGSLENTLRNPSSEYVLDRYGIREHACEILDGGEAAFIKRRDKYKLSSLLYR